VKTGIQEQHEKPDSRLRGNDGKGQLLMLSLPLVVFQSCQHSKKNYYKEDRNSV
jgi:hypothetical protein